MMNPSDIQSVAIAGRKIGPGHAPYVVAELSANHNGSLDQALRLLDKAASCGASAVKLQTYTPDTITLDCDSPDFRIEGGLWDGYTLYELYREAHTPFEWHRALFTRAAQLGITCFSTPFDETAVELLEQLRAPAYKIASFEAVDLPLIRCVAATGKPMIISTGMADLDEIGAAVEAARSGGCRELILLHCISSYPAPVEQSNLLTIPDMMRRFKLPVGLSDHTLGTTVAITGVALGSCFIEKHFTLSRSEPGPDAAFSLEPDELRHLCVEAQNAWLCLGEPGYERRQAEQANVQFRRSIYASRNIRAGEQFDSSNVRRVRPGFGLPPSEWDKLLQRRASKDIARGTAISWVLVD